MQSETPLTDQFWREWDRHYSHQKPMGWQLRRNTALPWVRFHALPESKRYAESDDERVIILSTANYLGERLLGPVASCWIIEAPFGEADGSGEFAGEWREDDDPDLLPWRFFVRIGEWQSNMFDQELLDIANDRRQIIWMARESGSVFAPYDGGFDLFPPTQQDVERLKAERQEWLSPRPDGL